MRRAITPEHFAIEMRGKKGEEKYEEAGVCHHRNMG
jgi:hypothetical protein